MYKKIIIPALILSLAANGILGYFLHNALNNLHYTEQELYKQDKIINQLQKDTVFDNSKIPDGYEIEYTPLKKPAKNRVKNRTLPNIYIPQRSPEPYTLTPYIQTPAYTPEYKNWYGDAPQHDFKQAQQARDLYRLQNAVEELQERETNRIFKSPLMNETPIGY